MPRGRIKPSQLTVLRSSQQAIRALASRLLRRLGLGLEGIVRVRAHVGGARAAGAFVLIEGDFACERRRVDVNSCILEQQEAAATKRDCSPSLGSRRSSKEHQPGPCRRGRRCQRRAVQNWGRWSSCLIEGLLCAGELVVVGREKASGITIEGLEVMRPSHVASLRPTHGPPPSLRRGLLALQAPHAHIVSWKG